MSISEESRHHLYQRLEGVLGAAEAATLMAHLPPVGWADVATKRDLDHAVTALEDKLDAGLAGVRTELAGVRGELHAGLADVRGELHAGLADVRGELHAGLADVRGELRTELHKEVGALHKAIGAQTWTLLLGFAGILGGAGVISSLL